MSFKLEKVLAIFDIAVFEYFGKKNIQAINAIPEWLARNIDYKTKEQFINIEENSFLSNFLIDAEKFWKNSNTESLTSGIWEIEEDGEVIYLEAIAVKESSKNILIIKKVLQNGEFHVYQKARNNLLEGEKLRQYISSLENIYQKDHEILEGFPDKLITLNQSCEIIRLIEKNSDKTTKPKIENLFSKNITGKIVKNVEYIFQNNTNISFRYQLENDDFEIRLTLISKDEVLLIERNITKQCNLERNLEKARKEAEKANRAKSDFLSHITHELRTPMSGVTGMNSLLLETNLDEEQKKYCQLVERSANSMIAIINDILDLSKIESGKIKIIKEELNLKNLCEEIAFLFEAQKNEKDINISYEYAENIPQIINSDALRIRQILINLVGNALKFTKKGHIKIVTKAAEKFIEISVQDSGIGIPNEKIEHIFGKFTQADESTTKNYGGTGLGLSITKNLTYLLGGEIGCTSEVDKGSTFWIRLPIDTNLTSNQPLEKNFFSEPEKQKENFSGLVLLVEDNEISHQVLKRQLENIGFAVVSSFNGEEAFEEVKKNNFAIIFMDCNMPILDGYETTKKIRSDLKSHVPILGISANIHQEHSNACIEAGMNLVIPKPIDNELLISSLKNILN